MLKLGVDIQLCITGLQLVFFYKKCEKCFAKYLNKYKILRYLYNIKQ